MPEIRHVESRSRFEMETGDGFACLEYQIENGCLVITHTFVPEELRGQRLADGLMRAALAFARERQMKVVARCGYADAFLRRHREFADLRAR